ncbi:MAG: translation initiation factor IF-2 [Candidatus Buchananbacteria bacterium]
MNVADLARKLSVTGNELLEKLPQLGFDIGRRAIKIDDRLADKIIDAWKRNAKIAKEKAKIDEIRGVGQVVAEEKVVGGQIKVPSVITVREFAALMGLPINKVLMELMKNGVLASMNERIDFDTAGIIGSELGFEVSPLEENSVSVNNESENKLKNILADDDENKIARPPVIVVMGHVDHGKTKILDAIRKTDVVSGESGGITQHVGAYQVHRHDRLITFIDTPGHEAFTAMRSRGARVADIAILVVAADDGVQPQTKEAIKIIQDAGLPFVVAINKIDKPEADIEKAKQDLSANNLLPEDWGGKTICVPVSAKTGQGIDDLLETVLLLADINKESMLSNPDKQAIGTIVESHIDKGEGPVATILIQSGTLRIGDVICNCNDYFGKVRNLKDYKGDSIKEALPGTPARILGLKVCPAVGSILEVTKETKCLNKDVKSQRQKQERDHSFVSANGEDDANIKSINLIIKADVLGSLEAIIESLAKLETKEIKIKVVSKGLGLISEADVLKAEATGAAIIGFHVKPAQTTANLARDKKVEIKSYEVIYHLIENIEDQMKDMAIKEKAKILIGKLVVLKVFRKEAKSMIIGGRVDDGFIMPSEVVIVIRDGQALTSGKVTRIELAKQLAEKVNSGQECGLSFEGNSVIEEKDGLEFYQEEK